MGRQVTAFDEIRARFPHLGFAVYALQPGGPVTLEVLPPEGASFTITRPTEAAALARAFPAPQPEQPQPDVATGPEPAPNVFD